MVIRPAETGDIGAIRSIAHGTWPAAYGSILSPEQMAYMLEGMYSEVALAEQMTDQQHRFLIAYSGEVAAGFASFEPRYQGAPRTRLHKLYVLPKVQRTNVGKALFEAVEAAAREAGDRAVELNVNKYNNAKYFYLRFGFKVIRDEVLDIGEGFVMDDHVLELSL